MWPRKAVTKWSHSNFGLWPLQHRDRSLPLYKSHHHEVLAPPQEAGAPGRAAARLALPARRLQRGQPSTEARRKQIQPRERSGRVRAVFHRKRGGEPTASSTRRRACTGGQRQSYKRAGYLTRSSGLVSWGLVGTAIELRSSSWRDRRRFLEGKERSLGCWGTRSGHPTHLPQAEGLPGFWHPREGVTGGPQLPSVACKASLGTDEPQAPCPGPVLPLPHQASGSQLHKVASATIPTRRPYQRLLISVYCPPSPHRALLWAEQCPECWLWKCREQVNPGSTLSSAGGGTPDPPSSLLRRRDS